MNLFLLHENALKAAIDHCDKHCIKMILETCQLLYSAWHVNRPGVLEISHHFTTGDPCPHKPYKCTHKNHPSSKWVRADPTHYDWAVNLGFALCHEYTRRYGKVHKCRSHLDRLCMLGFPSSGSAVDIDSPARKRALVGIPEGCKYFDCAINDEVFDDCAVYDELGKLNGVETYRKYYGTKNTEKWTLKWNKGRDDEPRWYVPEFVKVAAEVLLDDSGSGSGSDSDADPVVCQATYKSGKRNGEKCKCKAKSNGFCGRHKNFTIKQPNVKNKGTGAGGAKTNKNGLKFEDLTSLQSEYETSTAIENGQLITFRWSDDIPLSALTRKYVSTKKTHVFKYMAANNNMTTSVKTMHGCKSFDGCYINEEAKIMFIKEDKYQQVGGSICEKIQTPHAKIWQLSRTFPSYEIVYMYVLSEWFRGNCEAELEYLEAHGYHVFWAKDNDYKEKIVRFITAYCHLAITGVEIL
jgi:hypothetical protein